MRLLLDLRFQMLLVRQDVPVPLGDGLVLTHPDLLSHLLKTEMKARHTAAPYTQLVHRITSSPEFN